jgi:uncharacterized serine/threonine-protein kinase SgK494
VKTLWPVACREFLFLPEYKVHHGDIEEKFEIVTFIAKGAFGSVYKVRQISDSQVFALKVLEKSKVSRTSRIVDPLSRSRYHPQIILDDCIQQLKYEVLIQQAISHHPFITTSHSHWQNKGFVYQRESSGDCVNDVH